MPPTLPVSSPATFRSAGLPTRRVHRLRFLQLQRSADHRVGQFVLIPPPGQIGIAPVSFAYLAKPAGSAFRLNPRVPWLSRQSAHQFEVLGPGATGGAVVTVVARASRPCVRCAVLDSRLHGFPLEYVAPRSHTPSTHGNGNHQSRSNERLKEVMVVAQYGTSARRKAYKSS